MPETAVLELPELSSKTPVPPQLAKYRFQPGHAPLKGGGRPKGSKNAATILEQAAPKLAKHFIRRAFKSDPVLIDAMKRVLPVEQEGSADEVKAFQIIFANLPLDNSATPPQVSASSFTEPPLSDIPVLVNPQQDAPLGNA